MFCTDATPFPLAPLTVNGLQQARAFALRFSSLEIRAVYTSPILRAMQTAQEMPRSVRPRC
ncbi:MAG: histidine phosphatase family protein [Verrucomicrobia bacterium]|nr:histidine phosphatase family protein [Verrucomicrobiota bacterium]MBV8277206.1 histidine phosphatase family protein [Verrucomicrobiota bacterium]